MNVQKQMEMLHRLEEDDLYKKFAKQRAAEEARMNDHLKEEWETELEKLTTQ